MNYSLLVGPEMSFQIGTMEKSDIYKKGKI